jgi:hypothetical protein
MENKIEKPIVDWIKLYKFQGSDVVKDTKVRFLNAMILESVHGIATKAVKVAQISWSYYYLLREDDEFVRACTDARKIAKQYKADLFESALIQLAITLNPSAVIFGLKKYNPEDFGDKGIDKAADPVRVELSSEYQDALDRLLENKNGKEKTKSA